MSDSINLPIPRDYAKRDDEIRALAEQMARDSVVTQALQRYLIQVLTEVHESTVRPLLSTNAELLAALKAIAPEGWLDDGTMDHMPGVKLARAAVAKAEGRS